ncbi:protein NETWORKED 4A isoform X2 [Punica granatum]|uniref:Protein NETWORKED 4A isoform X2 n=1 Tax=Punica granatum TaxID=22663 RepID=A0A218W2D8_PUNGR|nr:protein NETWORKED 4A isoform X2 [Punica granatum]XP_031386080.1 protein NETWORKED 4A isoform X2 [Punica granatum]OWM66628.1 hypothetical protein CDL15_Pgr010279 [Punica granatum]
MRRSNAEKKRMTQCLVMPEMDQSVKRMLKLIVDDGDSFAKKAEMYYRKRPELISHVEEFYRMYRSLAERYDHLTVELRKNIPSDLQSQGSGISELGYETPSSLPSPDLRLARRKSGQQAAGFDFFLGAGGSSSDNFHREADESSSLTDSDPDCDASSVNNYSVISGNGGDQALQVRVFELENELLDTKEKLLQVQHEEASDAYWKDVIKNGSTFQDSSTFNVKYEEELRIAREKVHLSEEEISKLKFKLQKYESEALSANLLDGQSDVPLVEELKKLKEKLQDSTSEIDSLKKEIESGRSQGKNHKISDHLELAQKDAAGWKAKFSAERREVTKLQERLARLKSSLSDRDHEIRELKTAVSDAEEKIFPEKAEIKAEIARLMEECACMEEHLREWESRGRSMEEEIRKVKAEMLRVEERLNTEIQQLKADIIDRDQHILDLMRSFEAMQLEMAGLSDEVVALKTDVCSKDYQIAQINEQMHRLQGECAELIAASNRADGLAEELSSRVEELEGEVEKQRLAILEGAEEKREAIRQLCFSLEHYRSSYCKLRHAFLGHNNKQYRRTSVAY